MRSYYNPKLKTLAQKLRRTSTRAEVKLWAHLKGKRLMGCDFHRQKPIGNYIVDFVCMKRRLVIEVDGYTHRFSEVAERDREKQAYLGKHGFRVLRFRDNEVMDDIFSVVKKIENAVTDYAEDTPLDPLLIEGKKGTIVAICVSDKKGEVKKPVQSALLVVEHGIQGDAHAGTGRQVSLLAEESVDKMRGKGVNLVPGIFAENLLTSGLDLGRLKVGDRLKVGQSAVLEITQIGKECHQGCAIRQQVGDCVMPREGVFARVVQGGEVKTGAQISLISVIKMERVR